MLRRPLLLLLTLITSGCLSIQMPLNVPPKNLTVQQEAFSMENNSREQKKRVSPAKTALLGGIMFGGRTFLVFASEKDSSVGEALKAYKIITPIALGGAGIGYVFGKDQQERNRRKKQKPVEQEQSVFVTANRMTNIHCASK